VKLLLDENLSRGLVPQIADLFPGSSHVCKAGLLQVVRRLLTTPWQWFLLTCL
jgi:hypothetical protein